MYAGDQKCCNIIRDYEMYGNFDKLACRVLLATYEAVTNVRDFSRVFKSIPCWEVVIVEKGNDVRSLFLNGSFF